MAKNATKPEDNSGTTSPIETSIESIDETGGIVLLKTTAPEGETIRCQVNGRRHQGQVEGGHVWIRLTQPLGGTYQIDL